MDTLIRSLAIVATAIVALSFLLFAVDQLSEGSENQVRSLDSAGARAPSQRAINVVAPPARVERAREARHSSVRELIDDGNDVLLSPFAGLVDSRQIWIVRVVPGVIGLLLFGLGGLLLANAVPQRKHQSADWREATG